MGKFFFRLLVLLVIIIISLIIYLSYIGIETNKFDNLIKSKSNEVNRYVKLDFKSTKININLKELNLAVKLQEPEILLRDSKINLSKLDLYLPFKSFFSQDFLLERAEIAFIKNDIKDLIKISNIFFPKIINKKLNKVFAKGNLEGKFMIPFESNGNIGKNYEFYGKVSDADINFTDEFKIKNLTAEIDYGKASQSNEFVTTIKKGSLYDVKLDKSTINLKREENKTGIKSVLYTNGKLTFSQIKKLSSLMGFKINAFQNISGIVDLKTNLSFDLDKKFKVKNFLYSIDGHVPSLQIDTVEKKIIKEYLPEYETKMSFKDTSVKFTKFKSDQILELDGLIKSNDQFNSFKIKENYNYKQKKFNITCTADLTNYRVNISRLNYKKDHGIKSELNFDISFILNKHYYIKDLKYKADKTKIYLSNIKLNKNFETLNFEKLEVKTFLNELKNNDFLVKKTDKVIIYGEIFDAKPILKSLFKKNEKRNFSKNFNSEIKINFDQMLTGTNDKVFDFAMIALIKNGSYDKLNLKGNFSKNEIIEMSIYKVNEDKKTIQVISDRARPFIKNFDFIKGFEGGKLEYDSVISNKTSNSNLTITDFKVSKVPALAQLLSLASLQGIADTLNGEGIRFETFEMKSNSKNNLMNIEEAYASGPAVSILLDGYVDKGKTVSLRGTLVPARTINSIIATIPVVGEILVGKKIGEGVFGVSFKMKGPPKDVKTTVNPIKTLTPRFIVRAVEKMKRKKEEEPK